MGTASAQRPNVPRLQQGRARAPPSQPDLRAANGGGARPEQKRRGHGPAESQSAATKCQIEINCGCGARWRGGGLFVLRK